MRNKIGVVLLTTTITILCLFYLSFTFVSRNIQQKAKAYANGDYQKRLNYLDSMWNKEVYFGFTFGEIKEYELNLGLDLQGGMHVVLEVSPVEILMALSANSKDENFKKAIGTAQSKQQSSQQRFSSLFFQAYKDLSPNSRLADIFANSANKGRIDFNSSDKQVQEVIEQEVDDAIDRAYNIINTRIDKFGVTQPNIQRIQGTGRIQLELPGVDNPERVRKLLQGVAKLEFLEVYSIDEVAKYFQQADQYWTKKQKAESDAIDSLNQSNYTDLTTENTAEDDLLTDNEIDTNTEDDLLLSNDSADSTAANDSVASPLTGQASPLLSLLRTQDAQVNGLIYDMQDTSTINDILKNPEIKSFFPQNMLLLWDVKPIERANGTPSTYVQLYALKKGRSGAPLTGEVILDARETFDDVGKPGVSMQMNVEGARKWKKLTGKNIGQQIAIVLDDLVYSAPVVQGEIPSGNSSITGKFTIEEARDLANILKAGKLPAPTRIVEETVVGPSLGIEAQKQGILSIISGLILVVLFMLLYYSKGGLVADIALLINIFFIVGVMAQLQAALTLPGIAGIVLTIGMSIDANVLIFERIREELKKDPSNLLQAINQGYSKAFWTIFDANLTTLLTAVFLFLFGSGPVQGFGITLIVGIMCSFFSSVFITRVIVEYMMRKGNNSKMSFSSSFAQKLLKELNFEFISKRKTAYLFSTVLIAVGVCIIFTQGLNLGVDFKGGRSYVVGFTHDVVASKIKTALSESFEGASVEVKTFGSDKKVKITTSYLVDNESDTADAKVKNILIQGLTQFTGDQYQEDEDNVQEDEFIIASTSKVGATIADDIASSSRSAVIFSLIAIFFYIFIRFRKIGFSIGAVAALFHDTLMVLSVFAISRLLGFSFEVDQVFVAALLTIIGYSINDTVVVFDRVREYTKQGKGNELKETLNISINGTLNRTLITSFTTLLVVIILFLAGGEVLRGFSFALLIGIIFGTYSSVFIATPIVYDTRNIGQSKVIKPIRIGKNQKKL